MTTLCASTCPRDAKHLYPKYLCLKKEQETILRKGPNQHVHVTNTNKDVGEAAKNSVFTKGKKHNFHEINLIYLSNTKYPVEKNGTERF